MGLLVAANSGLGAPDLSGLPSTVSGNAKDTTTYDTYNVDTQSNGYTYNDPVTNVLVCKITDSTTPASNDFCTQYSQQGMDISAPWGAGSDEYTLFFKTPSGTGYFADYKLGGTVSNHRTAPVGGGNITFSRVAGEEQIAFVATGTQLRRYDTSTDAYADTGDFPYTSSISTWLMMNNDNSWATGINGSTAYKLELSTGTETSRTPAGLDEVYGGYNDFAMINATNRDVWDLNANTLDDIPYTTGSAPFHVPALRGFWVCKSVSEGGGVMPIQILYENGTVSSENNLGFYWAGFHQCGNWWDQAAGDAQYFLASYYGAQGGGYTADAMGALTLELASDASYRLLAHSYSAMYNGVGNAGHDYWNLPKAQISTDGRVVMFTSDMNNSTRLDVMVAEVPRA